jgi:DNA ligase (NAD+)
MQLRVLFVCLGAAAAAVAAEVPATRPSDQISALRREIVRHDELYHRTAAPEISDAEYDRLKQDLAALEREHPDAGAAAPMAAAIGDDRSGLFSTYRHRVPMMSLEKAYAAADVRAFHSRLAKTLGTAELDYVVEPKYDGLAVSVTYENGRLVRAVTRGNGVEGDDITANVLQISGLARELRAGDAAGTPDVVELRGEIYVPLAEFARINAQRDLAGEPRFANPRNLAAGTVRQLDAREVAGRGLRIVFFGIGACEPALLRPRSQHELHSHLMVWGLPVMEKMWTAHGGDELGRAIHELDRARGGLAFPTDGAVIKLDSTAQQHAAGVNETGPRWALAYKFAPERVETQLRAITLQVGRTGVLTPVAELVPVELAGSKVARATLHNREEIARKDIRVGDFVYVEKAGEVIPAIAGVNLARRSETSRPFEFPIACPECYAPLARSEVEVAVRCPNHACPAQVRRRVEHFASKACLDIDGLGPALIDALVGNGWVNELPDLYRLRPADLLTLGKKNEKTVERLLAAIENSKHAELWRVIHGMGLPQVGAATAKDLARQCGSLAALAEIGVNAAPVLAEPRYQTLIAGLIAVGFAPRDTTTVRPTGAATLAGKTFVLTGTLPSLTRAQATAKIEAAGGKVVSAVTPGTHFAVVGAEPGAKFEQARALGVVTIDEATLLGMLKGETGASGEN